MANWIGRTKRKKVHVVSTLKRPVPLEHYILAKGKMFKLMDAKGTFQADMLKEAVKDDAAEKKKEKLSARDAKLDAKGKGKGGKGGSGGGGGGGAKRGGGDKYGGKSYTQKSGGGGKGGKGGKGGGPNNNRGGR